MCSIRELIFSRVIYLWKTVVLYGDARVLVVGELAALRFHTMQQTHRHFGSFEVRGNLIGSVLCHWLRTSAMSATRADGINCFCLVFYCPTRKSFHLGHSWARKFLRSLLIFSFVQDHHEQDDPAHDGTNPLIQRTCDHPSEMVFETAQSAEYR